MRLFSTKDLVLKLYKNLPKLLSVCAISVIALLLYYPGLYGSLVFDDIPNLVENRILTSVDKLDRELLYEASFSSRAGLLSRPVSMLSFSLNHAFTALDPFYLKLTNLFIHVIAGLGLYLLLCSLLSSSPKLNHIQVRQRHWIALLALTVWVLNPFNLTTVLYVIQRMAGLAALFSIFGMYFYVLGRKRQLNNLTGWPYILAAYVVFVPLATLSKENGILLVGYLFLIELIFYRFRLPNRGATPILAWHSTVFLLPLGLLILLLITNPEWILRTYSSRDFTLTERLLTQSRALWFYISAFVYPDISRMGLYHDGFTLSRTLTNPWTTLPAVIGLIIVGLAAIAFVGRYPVASFGILFYLFAHSVESSFYGLEMMHEHRNYLPNIGLAFLIAYVLVKLLTKHASTHTRPIIIAGIAVYIAIMAFQTYQRAYIWGNSDQRILVEVKNHPNSARAQSEAAALYVRAALHASSHHKEDLLDQAKLHYKQAMQLDDYTAVSEIGIWIVTSIKGAQLDPLVYESLIKKLQSRPLAAATPTAVIRMLECHLRGPCNADIEKLYRSISALLTNPSLGRISRASLFALATDLALTEGDLEAAIYFSQQANRILPDDPQVLLNYASVLTLAGKWQDVEYLLERVELIDRNKIYKRNIERIRKNIPSNDTTN